MSGKRYSPILLVALVLAISVAQVRLGAMCHDPLPGAGADEACLQCVPDGDCPGCDESVDARSCGVPSPCCPHGCDSDCLRPCCAGIALAHLCTPLCLGGEETNRSRPRAGDFVRFVAARGIDRPPRS
jgi:hypothetical protein